jgi:hypothetical protein
LPCSICARCRSKTPGRKPALARSDLIPVACRYQECVGLSQLVQPFGAVTTGFSVPRFTSHLSYSLLVSDSEPLAQLYPGGVSTRKLGNPFQVTPDYLTIFAQSVDLSVDMQEQILSF